MIVLQTSITLHVTLTHTWQVNYSITVINTNNKQVRLYFHTRKEGKNKEKISSIFKSNHQMFTLTVKEKVKCSPVVEREGYTFTQKLKQAVNKLLLFFLNYRLLTAMKGMLH